MNLFILGVGMLIIAAFTDLITKSKYKIITAIIGLSGVTIALGSLLFSN